jgi:hypothetical protein
MRSEQEMLDMVRGKVVRLRRHRRIARAGGAVLALVVVVGGGVGLAAASGGDDDKQVTYTADQPPPPSTEVPPPSTQPPPPSTEVPPATTEPPPPTTEGPSPSGATIVMPDVTGMDDAAAISVLQEVGLNVRAVESDGPASAEVPAGTVISQSPAAGARVHLGEAVDVEVSFGG